MTNNDIRELIQLNENNEIILRRILNMPLNPHKNFQICCFGFKTKVFKYFF